MIADDQQHRNKANKTSVFARLLFKLITDRDCHISPVACLLFAELEANPFLFLSADRTRFAAFFC